MASDPAFEAFLRAFERPDVPEAALRALGQGKYHGDASRQLLQALTPRMPAGILPPGHEEHHPPQQAFLLLDDLEAFYGGAAGGGKSEALLKAAVQYVDFPHYRALIVRKTYPELAMPGAIMERAKAWFQGKVATWNGDEHTLTFPSGAVVTFAHAQYPDSVYRFGGTEFHFIAFDELTRFDMFPYQYLFSRLRRNVGDPIPLRMRSASNPGDIGHDWVKQRFVDPGDASRPFIPAKVADNPSLDIEEYLASLANLDPVTRQRLLKGDWSVTGAGGFFKREWFPVVESLATGLRRVVRYWDLAASVPTNDYPDPDWTRGMKMGLDWDGAYWMINMQSIRAEAGSRDALVKQTALLDGRKVPIIFEQEPGSAGKAQIAYFQKMLPGFTVKGVNSGTSKETRAGPLASQAQAGNVRMVAGPWCEDFLAEADVFPTSGVHDDAIDAASGAFGYLALQASSKLVSLD
jgi:predicted phage terminase large subunit-like protein